MMITQHANMQLEATKGIADPEDQHRSSMYALLSSLLCSPPTIDLRKVNSLSGGENKIGEAIKTLTILTQKLDIKTIEEYLLVGVGRNYFLMPAFT